MTWRVATPMRVLNCADGAVTGQFGSATSSLGSQEVLSLGSGNRVGLGAETFDAFTRRVATTANQSAMLKQLTVSNAGGVSLGYGGKRAQRLVQADVAGSGVAQVFATTSPELYAAPAEQSKDALVFARPDIVKDLDKTDGGGTAALSTRRRDADPDAGQGSFKQRSSGFQLGYVLPYASGVVRASLAYDDGSPASDTLNGSSNGFVASRSASRALPAVRGLSLTAHLAASRHRSSLSRETNAGKATASGVVANGTLAGLGLAHLADLGAVRVQTSADWLQFYNTVQAFNERNPGSTSDALAVGKQRNSGDGLQLAVNAISKLNDRGELSAGAKQFHDAHRGSDVSARLGTEATPFTVMHAGLGSNQVNLNMGLRFAVGDSDALQMRASSFGHKGSQLSVGYSKRF